MHHAESLVASKQFSEAQQLLMEVSQIAPKWSLPIARLAEIAQEDGNFELAISRYEQALTLEPDNQTMLKNLGMILHESNHLDRAAKCFEKAISFETDESQLAALHLMHYACTAPRKHQIQVRFDNNAENYDAGHFSSSHLLPANFVYAQIAQMQENVFDKVLDLGCGTGQGGLLLHGISNHLTGVDLSGKMLDSANSKNIYHRLKQSNIQEFLACEPENSFTLIFSAAVFTYFDNLDELLQLIAQTLKDDGLLVFDLTDTTTALTYESKGSISLQYRHNPTYVIYAAANAGLRLISRSQHVFQLLRGPEPSSVYLFIRQDKSTMT